MSNDIYTQLRIWRTTLKTLRRIHAELGEDMIAIVDRLATQELEKLTHENVQIQTVPSKKE